MRNRTTFAICALAVVAAGPVLAQSCAVDPGAVEAAIARLEPDYGGMLSDIGCDAPALTAHRLMCDSAENAVGDLWRMGRLDDLAWVHAVQNATGQEVDLDDPPRDAGFVQARDACQDAACLCALLQAHTNDSLGGTSPYPQ